jgi:L-threonylcarbamoyladenylate synthase
MGVVDDAVAALRAGRLVVLPTDTVYGLAATAYRRQPAHDLYRLKGRDEIQPTAILAASVDVLLESVPELRGRAATIARALLPGPYTLVLPNPARRFAWLNGSNPDAVGVRVPALRGPAQDVLERAGVVAATSANLAGGADPRRLEDVPPEIRAGVAVAIDAGELPGAPSTVIDCTGATPVVLRVGAGDPEGAMARLVALLG